MTVVVSGSVGVSAGTVVMMRGRDVMVVVLGGAAGVAAAE